MWGKRTTPPETGNIVPSSEKVSAISRIITMPIAHEMMAAGPATMAAFIAPKSQPEPMIEPTLANSRPIRPTSRRRLWLFSERSATCVSDTAFLSERALRLDPGLVGTDAVRLRTRVDLTHAGELGSGQDRATT